MNNFRLTIATPEREFYNGMAEYLSVDTPDGRVGFLCGALPRISALSSGRIEITNGEIKTVFYNADGMLRVADDGIYIITSDCASDKDMLGAYDSDFAAGDEREDKVFRKVKARIVTNISKNTSKKPEVD